MQFGYFVGSIGGGAALTLGGYSALGATMGLLFLGAAVTLARRPARQTRSPSTTSGGSRSRGRRVVPAALTFQLLSARHVLPALYRAC